MAAEPSVIQLVNNMQIIWIEQHKQHVENQAKMVAVQEHFGKKLSKLKSQLKVLTDENKKLSEELQAVRAEKSVAPIATPSPPVSTPPAAAPVTASVPAQPTAAAPAPTVPTKHIMLSYQWDMQPLAKRVYAALKARGLPVWMDVEGGMSGSINEAMAYGVENAGVFVCFMTNKYQASVNCSKELNYADSCRRKIVPIKAENFTPTGSLGLIIAGLLYIEVLEKSDFDVAMDNLYKEIVAKGAKELFQDTTVAPTKPPEQVFTELPWTEVQAALQDVDGNFDLFIGWLQTYPTTSAEFSVRIISALRNAIFNNSGDDESQQSEVAENGHLIVAAMEAFPNNAELIQHATKIFWVLHQDGDHRASLSEFDIEKVLVTALKNHSSNVEITTNIYAAWGLADKEECKNLLKIKPTLFADVRASLAKYKPEIKDGGASNIALLVVAAISVLAQFEYNKVGRTGDLGDEACYIVEHLMKYFLNSRDVQVTAFECMLVFAAPYKSRLIHLGSHLVEIVFNLMSSFPDDAQLVRQAMAFLVNFTNQGEGAPKIIIDARNGKGLEFLIEVFKSWKARRDKERNLSWRPNVHKIFDTVTQAGFTEEVKTALSNCGVDAQFLRSYI